jgi:membrane-bound lytic murein transglycosylase B
MFKRFLMDGKQAVIATFNRFRMNVIPVVAAALRRFLASGKRVAIATFNRFRINVIPIVVATVQRFLMSGKPVVLTLYSALLLTAILLFFVVIPRIDPIAPPPAQEITQETIQEETQEEIEEEIQPPIQLMAFSENPDVTAFIAMMKSKHAFSKSALESLFSKINPNQVVLDLIDPPPSGPPVLKPPEKNSPLSWDELRVKLGIDFWLKNEEALQSAEEKYCVPQEIIVAIIGIETLYGTYTGEFSVMETLATLGFYSPTRSGFFRDELEHFLILARTKGIDPLKINGSYAGAVGIPQFMPSSWRKLAVDHDGDNKVDLLKSEADSIGSIGNYLKDCNWEENAPVAHPITIKGKPKKIWLEAGMLPSLEIKELLSEGVRISQDTQGKALPKLATLIELSPPGKPTEYWLGYQNYYAITRYNRSTTYAMSVFFLSEKLKVAVAEEKQKRLEEELRKRTEEEQKEPPEQEAKEPEAKPETESDIEAETDTDTETGIK